MKILVIADQITPMLYDYFNEERFRDVNCVISCGDLPGDYLEFIVSMLNVPCFYVPGNHDTGFIENPPPGWIALDDNLVEHNGICIVGLGGSIRYKPGPFQYSEFDMKRRVLRLKPKIWLKKKKIDILVSHAPAYGLGDIADSPHSGFKVFLDILDMYQPKYFLHGHVHLNYTAQPRRMSYGRTNIINGYEYYVFDY